MPDYLRALRIRQKRLTELGRLLSLEFDRERKGNLPLHIPERNKYLEALRQITQAMEDARIALFHAECRTREEEKGRRSNLGGA